MGNTNLPAMDWDTNVAAYVMETRDFVLTPKPGFTPYPYPHPMNKP